MLYNVSLALFTDLYQLTMAYGYWKKNIHLKEAVFHLQFRKMPFKGSFAIVAGLETAIDFLQNFRYSTSDIEYLSTLRDSKGFSLFDKQFLDYLAKFQFSGDIDAMEEGSIAFPNEPLLRVKAPIIEAQLLESPFLNIINFQTLIATKSARVCRAAQKDTVIEFGMRRAQGIDGAISASRAAYIGGCLSTSHVLAGKLFNIPLKGTHAHSWVMAFEKEIDAFCSFAEIMPHNCVLLVDTYDSIKGVENAIQAAKSIDKKDFSLLAVRLDSGDLHYLSKKIRKILDKEGFADTQIMASNELDENLITKLKHHKSKVSIWGVGTRLVTGDGQPALDGVYKLSALQDECKKWIYKLKLSEDESKSTNPGILQVRRFIEKNKYQYDVLYDEILGIGKQSRAVHIDQSKKRKNTDKYRYKDILFPIVRKGKVVYSSPSLEKIRENAQKELGMIPLSMRKLLHPKRYFVGLEENLYYLKCTLIDKLKKS